MNRYKIFVIVSCVILIAAYFFTTTFSETEEEPTVMTQGMMAPTFILKNIKGEEIQINPANDKKVYVLNFWATWCPPCQEEMPDLERFYKKYGDKVQFYGINLEESNKEVTSYIKSKGYTYPILMDSTGDISQIFEISAIPTTIVINSEGKIVERITGGITLEELDLLIKKAGIK